MKLVFKRLGREWVIDDYHALPADSKEYLPLYGFRKSLQDAAAGDAKEADAEFRKKASDAGKAVNEIELAKFVDSVVVTSINDRLAKIKKGDVGVRESDPLRAIAVEMLRAASVEQKKKLPKGDTDAYKKLLAGTMVKYKAEIQAEYDRRKTTRIAIKL